MQRAAELAARHSLASGGRRSVAWAFGMTIRFSTNDIAVACTIHKVDCYEFSALETLLLIHKPWGAFAPQSFRAKPFGGRGRGGPSEPDY